MTTLGLEGKWLLLTWNGRMEVLFPIQTGSQENQTTAGTVSICIQAMGTEPGWIMTVMTANIMFVKNAMTFDNSLSLTIYIFLHLIRMIFDSTIRIFKKCIIFILKMALIFARNYCKMKRFL